MRVLWGEVDPLVPSPTVFTTHLSAITQSLSRINRWLGHGEATWSVAAHSVVAGLLAPDKCVLAALTHDLHEAICGDVPAPWREVLPEFQRLEAGWKAAVAGAYGVDLDQAEALTRAIDSHLAATESRDLGLAPREQIWMRIGNGCNALPMRLPFDVSANDWDARLWRLLLCDEGDRKREIDFLRRRLAEHCGGLEESRAIVAETARKIGEKMER